MEALRTHETCDATALEAKRGDIHRILQYGVGSTRLRWQRALIHWRALADHSVSQLEACTAEATASKAGDGTAFKRTLDVAVDALSKLWAGERCGQCDVPELHAWGQRVRQCVLTVLHWNPGFRFPHSVSVASLVAIPHPAQDTEANAREDLAPLSQAV